MNYTELSCREYTEILASKAPCPGGGGTAALAGALGCALGNMVGSLTVGKKKYADVEERIWVMKEEMTKFQNRLLDLSQKDTEVFAPLAEAYSLPVQTEEEKRTKEQTMEECLRSACSVPLEIMEVCAHAVVLLEEFAKKGSRLAVSDAGCGASLCKAAIESAALNVYINTRSMKDKEYAAELENRAGSILEQFVPRAQAVYGQVLAQLRGK